MTSSSLVSHDNYGVQKSTALDQWGGYITICTNTWLCPNTRQPPLVTRLPSDIGSTNVDPISAFDYTSPQQIPSQKNSLPLLQFGDWEEGRTYDEHLPACIHYLIEWKVTINNRTVAKDTEQDLVLAPRFYWKLFLQPKLEGLIVRKYPHRKLESDDTSVVVSATRQKGLVLRFDRTDIHWTSIEKQLLDWGDVFLAGKKLRLVI